MTDRPTPESALKELERRKFEAHMLKLNACTRLARQQEYLGGHYRTTTVQRAWELWQAALASSGEQESPKTALQRYNELGVADEEVDPIERLRAFCSFAMNGQDWLDVEDFFDALPSIDSSLGEEKHGHR